MNFKDTFSCENLIEVRGGTEKDVRQAVLMINWMKTEGLRKQVRMERK